MTRAVAFQPTKLSYTVDEAAAAIGCSRAQLYRMRKAGEIEMFSWAGRTLIRTDVLMEALDKASGRRAA